MSDHGIKVSLPGYDVLTATPEQCVLHSGYPSPKIAGGKTPGHSGVVVVTFTGAVTPSTDVVVYTFEHGYSRIPWTLGQGRVAGVSKSIPEDAQLSGPLPIAQSTFKVGCRANDTDFELYVNDSDGWIQNGTTIRFSYLIFAEDVS